MAYKEGEKQGSFYIDGDEKDQFNKLCRTFGISLSQALRNYMVQAVREQSLGISVIAHDNPQRPPVMPVASEDQEYNVDTRKILGAALKRIDSLERSIPKFDIDELKQMKREVLNGDFGSMRYRMGIIENQVQELGGSIAWTNKPVEKQLVGGDS